MPRMPKNPCNPEFIVRLLYGDFPQNQSHTLVQTGGGKKVSLVFREDLHNIAIPFTVSCLNTYVPGGKTWPGTSTGLLNVTIVSLSHASALAIGAATNATSATSRLNNANFNLSAIFPPFIFGDAAASSENRRVILVLVAQLTRGG